MTFSSTLSGPCLPPLQGAPQKIIIFLHGYGANGNDLLSLGSLWQPFLPTALFLAPDAPFACEISNFGRQWFSIENWNPERLLKGAIQALPYLNNFVDEALQQHHLTAGDIALVGFSQGAMMAMQYALSHHDNVAGVLAYSGALLWPESQMPQPKPPILLVHGEEDHIVPFQAFHNAQRVLKILQVPYQSHAIKGLAHGINEQGLTLGLSFLKEKLYADLEKN